MRAASDRPSGGGLPRLATAMLPLVALAGIGTLIYLDRQENAREAQRHEAERAAQVREQQQVFACGNFDQILELCQHSWSAELQVDYQLAALAWTWTCLDGYFLEGTDRSSWRRLSCIASGVERGPRVAHPLVESLPAEATPGADSQPEDRWEAALSGLAHAPLGPGELAVELLPDPRTGEMISRRWRGVEGGAKPYIEPANAPPFAMLIANAEFPLAPGAAPPPLRTLNRYRWAAQPNAAFALIEKALPPGAGVVEITLSDDEIELSVESPTPAFDGDPPAPYGDQEFDEYGVAQSDWWYPRTDPGFGCRTGRPLAEVRAEYATAKARLRAGASPRAWYSCSPAYSDGHRGVWHLWAE